MKPSVVFGPNFDFQIEISYADFDLFVPFGLVFCSVAAGQDGSKVPDGRCNLPAHPGACSGHKSATYDRI
jgi:hypothetical protein